MAKTRRPVPAKTIEGKRKNTWGSLAVVCVLVVGVYAYTTHSGGAESLTPNAADTYYNLLVRGFRAGHLSLEKDVPPGLTRLADPYDPTANGLYRSIPFGVHDMSYYKGKLYLYFGVTPALILFWPFAALTGQYLFQRQAVAIFCTIGFLVSVGLLRALWRRYFAEVSVGVVMACALALGLATGIPILVSGVDVYQVPIGCGYMLTMLALAAIWCALHEPERRWKWLAAASTAYGLAVGARPNLLFGAVILLVPVAQAWRERRQVWAVLMAAMGPIVLIGLGLMFYNSQRFDSPFEFGQRYQLAACQMVPDQFFSLHYLLFNFRVYFLEPVLWSARFPFVHEIASLPLPPGHIGVERGFGIFTNIPLACLALAVPWLWRHWSSGAVTSLRWFITAVALLIGICALTLGFFWAAYFRYEMDFLPALLLLAVVGILGLERVLADRPASRRPARWGWGLLLGFSVAFNLLASVEQHAQVHNAMGVALTEMGRLQEAMTQYDQALRIQPDYAEAYNDLGIALAKAGRVQEAAERFDSALQIKSDLADVHNNLGHALILLGRAPEAIGHYEQALRVKPNFADAHYNLGVALAQVGRVSEAIEHWKQAVQIQPDYADAHFNLGMGLEQAGKLQDAIRHYQQALRINPNLIPARDALARLHAGP